MTDRPHQPDYVLYFTVVILCAIGVVTVYSASVDLAITNGLKADHFALYQLAFAATGLVLMSVFVRIPPRVWYKLAPLLMLINLGLLVLVKFIGKEVLGGRRWLGTTSVHIQPSELAIVAIAMYLAFFFTKKITVLHSFKHGFVPAIVVILINFFLIFIEPDMGTAMTLFGVSYILLIASGTPLRRVFGLLLPAIPGLLLLALSGHYRSGRLTAFIHPFAHQGVQSYQLLAGWTAITSGGWFGKGFGMSLAKTGYLPEPYTDFIFPVLTEEWGYVGAIALIITFGVLVWRGFLVARHAPNRFMALFAVGLTGSIAMGTLINLGAVTGLLPVTGIPLPFISYGGTDLMVNLIAMGMLLSISRYTLDEEPAADELAEVIEVDDFRSTRPSAETRDSIPIIDRPAARTGRSAKVEPIRPTAKQAAAKTKSSSSKMPADSWRARQETAATTRGGGGRPSGSKMGARRNVSTPTGGTWRERQERADSWKSSPGSKKPKRRDR